MKRIILKQAAKDILQSNQYMTLGTVSPDGRVWVSPVVYATDGGGNFYFLSQTSSQHSRNIEANSLVSMAIFDSRQKWGEGVGLQIEGTAGLLSITGSVRACDSYFRRKWPFPGSNMAVKGFKRMVKGKIYRFYKITPTRIWMNDPRAEKDVRVRVRI